MALGIEDEIVAPNPRCPWCSKDLLDDPYLAGLAGFDPYEQCCSHCKRKVAIVRRRKIVVSYCVEKVRHLKAV